MWNISHSFLHMREASSIIIYCLLEDYVCDLCLA
nr:MAG TPA: hypothetical protein [Caudoviricetes sp.]